MSPLPWPLIGRRAPQHTGAATPPTPAAVVTPADAARVVFTHLPAAHSEPEPEGAGRDVEHEVMYRNTPWLRREEDVVLARLARLTAQYDPWTAASRLFADNPKETLE